MFNFLKKVAISNRAEEAILYEYVFDELEEGYKVKGLWAKAIAMSEGNENKAKSLYMQYRVQDIKDYFTSLKIAYEELSKTQIDKKLKNLEKEPIKVSECKDLTKNEKDFLLKYNQTTLTDNVEITNSRIIIKTKDGIKEFVR
jgi:hypothetical protein